MGSAGPARRAPWAVTGWPVTQSPVAGLPRAVPESVPAPGRALPGTALDGLPPPHPDLRSSPRTLLPAASSVADKDALAAGVGSSPHRCGGPDPRGPSRRCDVQRPQAWACGCVTRSLPPSSRGFSDPLRLPLRDTVPRFRPPQARGNGLISRPSPSSCPGALFQTRSCHRLWGLGLQSFGGRFSTNHDCH